MRADSGYYNGNTWLTALIGDRTTSHSNLFGFLLANGADKNGRGNYFPVLGYACANDNYAELALLLAHGADVHARSAYANSPLLQAIGDSSAPKLYRTAMVKLLLENGAASDILEPNKQGDTPLGVAAKAGLVDIVKLFEIYLKKPGSKKGYDPKATQALKEIFNKINPNNPVPENKIKQLILAGADPNVKADPDLYTSNTTLMDFLITSTHAGSYVQSILFLLEHDTDPNDWSYSSPLHEACFKGMIAVVRKLIEKGARISDQTAQGDSPLSRAVMGRYVGVVQLLLEKGAAADIKIKNCFGSSPLSYAQQENLVDILRLFSHYLNGNK